MALTKEQLQEKQAELNANRSNVTTKRLLRVNLPGFMAKYVGRNAQYNEYTGRDEVPFTFYWTKENFDKFSEVLQKTVSTGNMNQKQASEALKKFFSVSTNGEPLIYASKRMPLADEVALDPASDYTLRVDVLHSEGRTIEGENVNNTYVKVIDVIPTRENREYKTLDIEHVNGLIGIKGDEPAQIEGE